MFKKTISTKPVIKKRNNEFNVMFSRILKNGSPTINLSISNEACQSAKLYKADKVEVLVDVKAKKVRIERCTEGAKLGRPSSNCLRCQYSVTAGRLTTKPEMVLINDIKTGTGFIEFSMPEELHIKRKTKVTK